ncbi:VanZ family protein [Acidobacteria bacterium AH-259-A15]|nr:VanZ family protein [Acidobacteria bacterium AH-259-A15]
MSNHFLHWVPAFAYAALIFFLSHQSDPPGGEYSPDYVTHFLEYGFFALTLVWGATSGFPKHLTLRGAIFAWTVAALYALSDEFHQSFVPNRDASLIDVTVDVAGAMACLGVIYLTKKGRS